jgi:hypothetical protein
MDGESVDFDVIVKGLALEHGVSSRPTLSDHREKQVLYLPHPP